MKLLHITCTRKLTSGQRKQLLYEYNESKRLKEVEWHVIAWHTEYTYHDFENQIPKLYRALFLRNLYVWFQVLKHKNNYDLILMRHITFDPFSIIFAPLIKNRITVHHAKEVHELKLIRSGGFGKVASLFESLTGRVSAKYVCAIAGVTDEIAKYQNTLHSLNKPTLFYPNGIDLNLTSVIEDSRDEKEINIAFICGKFSSWHGLDLLLEATNKNKLFNNIRIHLIGALSTNQHQAIKDNFNSNIYIVHGVLEAKKYIKILTSCDVGLSSLALHRKQLKEASTLKVREMLAMGIPVYSCHIDSGISDSIQFYYFSNDFDIDELINFAMQMKQFSRLEVRNSVVHLISKEVIMNNFITQLRSLKLI